MITLSILTISTTLCILQYVTVFNKNNEIIKQVGQIQNINNIQSQILYIKEYTDWFTIANNSQQSLAVYAAEITELDTSSQTFISSFNANVTYNDRTSQLMLLLFSINKLVSEGNFLTTSSLPFSSLDSHVFYVSYNSVNGIGLAS